MTVRTTINMDDRTYEKVKKAASDSGVGISEWLTKAAVKRLLGEDARAEAVAQRLNPEAARQRYDEAERELAAAEAEQQQRRRRHGDAA